MTIKVLNALIAVVGGVAGAIVLYYLLNKLAELLPGKWEDRVKPYLYLLPALAAIGLYLIYPTIQTFVYSFANARSTEFVGFSNYTDLLSSPSFPEHAVQHVPLDPDRAGRGDRPRPADRDPRRPAQAPGREAVEDADLPADGDRRR